MLEDYIFPTSAKEMKALGWERADIILFTGDAFIDHPSFGTAVIARILQKKGYRVAIVPQPNWRDDLRDFKKLGSPRLFFGVNSGAMDSMVNHYTANKRLRSDDAYTPDGKASFRPDYAVTVYCNILKEIYPETPVVIGGIEASLRRFTHYDYWKDRLLPSILIDSKADYITYGMGERATIEIAEAYDSGKSKEEIESIRQIAFVADQLPQDEEYIVLNSYETILNSKSSFIDNFNIIETEANKLIQTILVEPYKDKYVIVNPSNPPATTEEIDSFYDLPYTKEPHPRYKGKRIPAFDMIKNSVTIHRGCFGGCSFCTIAAHQGRFIQSRSEESIISEIENLVKKEWFKGVISDLGAPTANMYMMGGKDLERCSKCVRRSCLYPGLCSNLAHSHDNILELYRRVKEIKGVKRTYVGSGIRYDLFIGKEGYLDSSSKRYLEELVKNHTSGRLKVAPEHTQKGVLDLMSKPPFRLFEILREKFDEIIRRNGLKYQLVPYFISSHPGCTLDDMEVLAKNPSLRGLYMDQVQDFTPTPMTASSVVYYTGMSLKNKNRVFVERDQSRKKEQKSLFFKK